MVINLTIAMFSGLMTIKNSTSYQLYLTMLSDYQLYTVELVGSLLVLPDSGVKEVLHPSPHRFGHHDFRELDPILVSKLVYFQE